MFIAYIRYASILTPILQSKMQQIINKTYIFSGIKRF